MIYTINDDHSNILSLLSSAITGDMSRDLRFPVNWQFVNELSVKHAVIPIIYHAVLSLQSESKPPD